MNGKCVAAAALLVAVLAIVNPVIADNDDSILPVDGQCPFSLTTLKNLPHKYDCTRFFTCFRGVPLPRQCPIISGTLSRYHFNPVAEECDFPANAGCTIESSASARSSRSLLQVDSDDEDADSSLVSESSDSEESSNSTVPPPPTECPHRNGRYAVHIQHENNCTLFYKCNWGRKILTACPSGLHFNPYLQVCDWPQNAGCTLSDSDSESTESSDSETEAVTDEAATESPIDVQADEETESTSEAASEESTESSSSTASSIPTECPSTNGKYTVNIAHESNCSLFYTCNWGKGILQVCPSGLHFNPALQVCDWPQSAGCTASESNADSDSSESETTDDESATEEAVTESNISAQDDEETDDDANEGSADSTESSDDVDGTESSSSTASSIPTECPSTNGKYTVNIAHESNCSLFYTCNWGKGILQVCPSGLHFNPALQVCDWPQSAGCTASESNSDSGSETTEDGSEAVTDSAITESTVDAQDDAETETVPEDTTDAVSEDSTGSSDDTDGSESLDSTTPTIPTECPSTNSEKTVIIAHESNCNLFYICNWGTKILMACPSDLYFNPVLQVCDWPQTAGCTASESTSDSESETTEDGSEAAPEESTVEDVADEEESSSSTTASIPTECPTDDSESAVHIAHESNCNLFYKCVWGSKVQMACANGLTFNPVLQICDWPHDSTCNATNVEPDDDSSSESTTISAVAA